MEIKLTYKNDKPPFEKSIASIKGFETPIINLTVMGENNRSRKTALLDYLMNIQSLFRDLKNMHESDIETLELLNLPFGDIKKIGTEVEFKSIGSVDEKYNIIMYSFLKDSIKEDIYFTKNGLSTLPSIDSLTFEGNVINSEVIERLRNNDNAVKDKAFLVALNLIFSKNLPEYGMIRNQKTGKIEYTYKNTSLKSIESIRRNDVYLFFKLVEILLQRGNHFGVYFVDCSYYSSEVLNAIINLVNLFYKKNRIVFLYNLSDEKLKEINHNKNVTTVKLPNHKEIR